MMKIILGVIIGAVLMAGLVIMAIAGWLPKTNQGYSFPNSNEALKAAGRSQTADDDTDFS